MRAGTRARREQGEPGPPTGSRTAPVPADAAHRGEGAAPADRGPATGGGASGPAAIHLHRVYDRRSPPAGLRVLVDGLWPRGVSREALGLHLWLRSVAPSDALRCWYGHRPERWPVFARRYREELRTPERAAALDQLRTLLVDGPVVLLYGSRDDRRNQAVVLRAVLLATAAGRPAAAAAAAAEPGIGAAIVSGATTVRGGRAGIRPSE